MDISHPQVSAPSIQGDRVLRGKDGRIDARALPVEEGALGKHVGRAVVIMIMM